MSIVFTQLKLKQQQERAQRAQLKNQHFNQQNPNAYRTPNQQQSYQNFNNPNINNPQRPNNQNYGFSQNRQQNYEYVQPTTNYQNPTQMQQNNNYQFQASQGTFEGRGRGRGRGRGQFYQQGNQYQGMQDRPDQFQGYNSSAQYQQNQQPQFYNRNQQMRQGQFRNNYQNPNPNPQYDQQQNYPRNNRYNNQEMESTPPLYQPNQYRGPRNNSNDRNFDNNFGGNPTFNNARGRGEFRGRGTQFRGRGGQFRGRGTQFRGRGIQYRGRGSQYRGRGRSNQSNQYQIMDTRPMTYGQSQQRMKKFVNLNQQKYVGQPSRTSPQNDQQQRGRGRGRSNRGNRGTRGRGRDQSSQRKDKRTNKFIKQDKQPASESAMEQSEDQYEQSQSEGEDDYGSSKMQNQNKLSQEYEYQNDDVSQHQDQGSQEYEQEDDYSKQSISASDKSSNRFKKSTGGQADKMCSIKQFNNRMNIFLQNNMQNVERSKDSGLNVINTNLRLDTSKSFSIFQINKRTNLPDLELAMKKFQRSANRADDEDNKQSRQNDTVYVPRSTTGLVKTMKHIKKQILDSDSKKASELAFPIPENQKKIEFIQIYNFLWDRMREMIKDITRLDQESKYQEEIIKTCEQITRFFILSINEGRKKYAHGLTFDDKMNHESLTKIMTPLLGLYAESKLRLKKLIKELQQQSQQVSVQKVKEQMKKKGIYISPNEAEVTAYAILFSQDYRKYLYENIFTGFQLTDTNPLFDSKQIQQVLSIKSALNSKNYSKYFEMLNSEDYDYLVSSLMVLNINSIRKQMSSLLENSMKYIDDANKPKKGVNEAYFKKMLHFSQNQNQEYIEFLSTIQAYCNNNNYIQWSGQEADGQKIYKIPPFPLDFKLKRIYYQTSQNSKSMMRRSQIVERSWKKSTYIQQLISSFLNRDYVPLNYGSLSPIHASKQVQQISKTPAIKINNQNEMVSGSGSSGSGGSNTNKAQQLVAKQQQLQRRKFIDKVSTKIADLIRPDNTKQQEKLKATKSIFNIFVRMHQFWLQTSLRILKSQYKEQLMKQMYMIKINEYQKMKQNFIQGFNVQKHFAQTKQTPMGMSQLLKRNQINTNPNTIKMNLIQVMVKNNIKQFNIKILIDVTKQELKYIFVANVIKNMFEFFVNCHEKNQDECLSEEYVYIEGQNTINVAILCVNEQKLRWKKFLGADVAIFLQTKPEAKNFSLTLSQFKNFQNCIRTTSLFNLPIGVIRLIDSTKNSIYEKIGANFNFQSSQFLKSTSLQLSPSLCFGLSTLMDESARKYRRRPKIEVKSLGQILKTINLNMEYVQKIGNSSEQRQKFLEHQEYINMCIEQICRLSKCYYLSAPLFENWLQILREVEKQSIPLELDKIEQLMRTQFRELQNLSFKFNIKSLMEENQNKTVFEKQDYVQHYFNICKRFDPNNKLTQDRIVKAVEALDINKGEITGNVYQFYKQILSILSKLLTPFNVVVPKDFKFYINPKDLQIKVKQTLSRIRARIEKQQSKLARIQAYKSLSSLVAEPSNIISLSTTQEHRKSQRQRQFEYQRAQWLNDVKKKIKAI